LQGYTTLVRFGAENSLGAVVGLSLIRELGPVLTALLVTGRAGSSVTAEIGTMKATEQLDGLRMMAIDPVDYVVRPRAWAMWVSMPLLSALFIVALISTYRGYTAEPTSSGVSSATTSTVVIASVSVLIFDYILTALWGI